MSRRQGKYRITAVADQTGVAPATLRAWERRYGLPDPGRTDSAYRLYSEEDIAMVRRVRELCDAGMSPSEAAKQVLAEAHELADAPANEVDPFTAVREAIVAAVVAFDHRGLEVALLRALSLGAATLVTDEILIPAMRDIGDQWHDGEIGVAAEHMASQMLGDAVTYMLRLVDHPDAERTVVLACFADEEHSFPVSGIAMQLAAWGHRVIRLGARTPPAAIKHAVEHLSPHLVGLSCTMVPPPHRARELVEGYAQACGKTPWIVGGAAVGELTELIEAAGGTAFESPLVPRRLRGPLETLMSRGRRNRGRRV